MRLSTFSIALLLATTAAAQSAPRQLTLVPAGRVALSGGAREVLIAPDKGGRTVIAPRNGWDGAISVFDSNSVAMPWKIAIGRNDNAEIMFVSRAGWIAGSNTMWVSDRGYSQVALVDNNGKVTKSIEYASWVHPSWARRRDFPVFGAMEPLAVYADQTMLILPYRERSLISTPGYDHTVQHLLRTTWSGAIQRDIATLPLDNGSSDFTMGRVIVNNPRSRNGTGYTMNVPFVPRSLWSVSTNGMHIAIAIPGVTAADSGSIRVVSLNDRGDTVFARKYPYPALRVDKAMVDRFLANLPSVGSVSAERMRDSASKQIPLFQSLLNGVIAAADGSTWLVVRAPSDSSKEVRAMLIDPRGDLVGTVTLPENERLGAATIDHIWTFEMGRLNTPTGVVRYTVRATTAPPARNAKPSASPSLSRPER